MKGPHLDRFLRDTSLQIDAAWEYWAVPLTPSSYSHVLGWVPDLSRSAIVRSLEFASSPNDRDRHVGSNVITHKLLGTVMSGLDLVRRQNPGAVIDEMAVIGVGLEASAGEVAKALAVMKASELPDPWDGPRQVHRQTVQEARRMVAGVRGVTIGWIADTDTSEAVADIVEINEGRLGRLDTNRRRDKVLLPGTSREADRRDLAQAVNLYPGTVMAESELEVRGGSVSGMRLVREASLSGLPAEGDPYEGVRRVERILKVRSIIRDLPEDQQLMICGVFGIDLDGDPYDLPIPGDELSSAREVAEDFGLGEPGRTGFYRTLNALRRSISRDARLTHELQ